ncbi:MAG: exosortase/archaeosortase family protein [Limnohabitans sp.]|nr:exosortase/archaeosortase family protein [Limnohabitans sp.]
MTSSNEASVSHAKRAVEPRAAVRTLTATQLVVGGAILAVVVVAVFFRFFQTQVRWAIVEPADWGHTLLVPFIAGYFVYLRRDEIAAAPWKSSWVGFPIMLLGIAGFIGAAFGPSWFVVHHNAQGIALGVTLFGLAFAICGWRVTKLLIFPLCYFIVFGQSVTDRLLQLVTERMQDWSAIGAGAMLTLCGIDADRSGNVISVYVDGEARQLNVAEACSGMRMLVAFLALGVAIAYTGLTGFWRRAVLVVSGFPVALFVNMLRVFTLGVLSLWNADFATGDFHSFIGLLWLVPALLAYLGIMWFLNHIVVDAGQAANVGAKNAASQASVKSNGGKHAS